MPRRRPDSRRWSRAVEKVIGEEEKAGLTSLDGYESFARQVKQTKLALVEFLLQAAQ